MPIDYKKYPHDWKDRIRPEILKRARYRCEICGVRNHVKGYRDKNGVWIEADILIEKWARENGIKIIRVVLTIAHLNHDIKDNRPENLQALCQLHHNRLDGKNRALTRAINKANRTAVK